MKKGLLSKGVFKEMFCQMKVVGVLACVVYALAGILFPVGLIVERYQYKSMGDVIEPQFFPTEYFYVIYGLAFVFVPLLIDVAFSFLEKRNASDYYHALPIKRVTLYVSSLAAVFAWMGVIYVVATGFTLAIVGIDSYMMLDMVVIGKLLLKSLVACVFIMGVCCLGTSLTGTKISTALVIVLILIGPRSIIGIIQAMIEDQIPFAVTGYGYSITNHGYNIIINVFFGNGYVTGLSYAAPLIYSTIVGIIYLSLGGFAFIKRKSESAGQSTVHPAIQVVCRIVPAFMCALIAIWLFIGNTLGGENDPMTYFGVVVLLIISLIIYFVYDLITNRKFKSFIKSVKQLPIFLGFVVAAAIVLMIYVTNEKEWRPEAEDIDGLEFYKVDYLYSFLGVEKIEVEDDEIYKIIEKAYSRQIGDDGEVLEEYYIYDEEYDTYYMKVNYAYHETLLVGIKENGFSRYRQIHLLKEEYEEIVKACAKVVEDEGDKIKLPRYDNMYTWIHSAHMVLTDAGRNRVYNCLKSELETVGWKDIIVTDESWIDYISIIIDSDTDKDRDIQIPVTDKIPKTKALLLELAYETANMKEDFSELQAKDYVEKWIENYNSLKRATQLDFYYLATNADVDKQAFVSMDNRLSESKTEEWFKIISKVVEEDKHSSDNKVILYMNMDIHDIDEFGEYAELDDYDEYGYDFISVTVAYMVSEETAKEFIDFMDDFKWSTEEEEEVYYEYIE
ncbi:MAG: hypothetical protein IJD02_03965 [Lachnospiraceae bacterium]|nr:hypothetical protein [Lachnospiraceae bacterium]